MFAGPHIGTLADLLGLNLSTVRYIHKSAGITTVVFIIIHILLMVASQPVFPLALLKNLFAVIVSTFLVIVLC